MAKQKSYDDALDDACDKAWRAGINPDLVSPDHVQDYVDQGFDRFEASNLEVQRLRKLRKEW